jgi:hypothetical protein
MLNLFKKKSKIKLKKLSKNEFYIDQDDFYAMKNRNFDDYDMIGLFLRTKFNAESNKLYHKKFYKIKITEVK